MLQCTHMIQVACANLVMLWWLICYPKSWRKTSLTKSIRLMKIHSKKFCIFTVVIILLDRIHIWGYNRSYNREKSCCGQISVSYFCLFNLLQLFQTACIFLHSVMKLRPGMNFMGKIHLDLITPGISTSASTCWIFSLNVYITQGSGQRMASWKERFLR